MDHFICDVYNPYRRCLMEVMDIKEKQIFQHYADLLEQRLFDEYDILGFLIFIRRHLDKTKYPAIAEVSNLIAHRERNQGIVLDGLKNAMKNNYMLTPITKKVKQFRGISKQRWRREWTELGKDFSIALSNNIISEIMLCIFSLASYTKYKKGKYCGELKLFQDLKNNELALMLTEGKKNSLYICFSKYGKYQFCKNFNLGRIDVPVKAIRENESLRLVSLNEYII